MPGFELTIDIPHIFSVLPRVMEQNTYQAKRSQERSRIWCFDVFLVSTRCKHRTVIKHERCFTRFQYVVIFEIPGTLWRRAFYAWCIRYKPSTCALYETCETERCFDNGTSASSPGTRNSSAAGAGMDTAPLTQISYDQDNVTETDSGSLTKERAEVYQKMIRIQSQSEFFRGLSASQTVFLAEFFRIDSYRSDDVLIKNGDVPEWLGVVLSGTLVAVVRHTQVRHLCATVCKSSSRWKMNMMAALTVHCNCMKSHLSTWI